MAEENYAPKSIHSWQIPEYNKYERTRSWYIMASGLAVILLLLSLKTANLLFAVIIIVYTLITILHDGKEPDLVDFSITGEGLLVGKKFYDFDEIKNFSVIYKPRNQVKNLYFEFKGAVKPRLSIPLKDSNPLQIRETLLKYLREDLERTDEPVSEGLAKLLKL